MRTIILTAVSAVFLVGCGAQSPRDGDEYFNNITTDTSTLETEQQRLKNAETPQAADAKPVVATTPQDGTKISDTQDFDKTKQRETIASDAAKIAALKGTYQQVEPTAVPTRGGGINLASYALQQTNPVGEKAYRRLNIGLSNCSRYSADPDAAQRAFLAAGGPEKDRKRLDPDGDGFACGWNPDIYRHLLQTNG